MHQQKKSYLIWKKSKLEHNHRYAGKHNDSRKEHDYSKVKTLIGEDSNSQQKMHFCGDLRSFCTSTIKRELTIHFLIPYEVYIKFPISSSSNLLLFKPLAPDE